MSLRRCMSCAQPSNIWNHLTRSTSASTHSQIFNSSRNPSSIPTPRLNPRISTSKPTTSTCNFQSLSQSRCFHSSTINRSSSPSSSSSSQQQLKDEQIKSPFVRLVTDQGLSNQASKTKDILREMDRSQYWLVQVKAGVSTDPVKPKDNGNGDETGNRKGGRRKSEEEATASEESSSSTSNRPILENLPLVKFISKKEAYDKAKALKLQKKSNSSSSSSSSSTLSDLSKSSSSSPKLIQLTWSVSPNDLDHKLKNARKDLINKGTKVKVEVITKKGGGKSVAGGEMEKKKLEFLKKVEEVICEELRIYEEFKDGEGEGGEGKLKEVRKGRRVGEIEWKNNGAVARCTFELVRSKS